MNYKRVAMSITLPNPIYNMLMREQVIEGNGATASWIVTKALCRAYGLDFEEYSKGGRKFKDPSVSPIAIEQVATSKLPAPRHLVDIAENPHRSRQEYANLLGTYGVYTWPQSPERDAYTADFALDAEPFNWVNDTRPIPESDKPAIRRLRDQYAY